MKNILSSKKAITKIKAMIVAVIIIIGAIAGVAYYMQLPAPTPTPSPVKQELIIGTVDRPKSLDPGLLRTSASTWIANFVLDTLVRGDPETFELIPWLAKSWEISEDGKTIDFYLEEGVMFHDGTELTADDVKFTFDRLFHTSGVLNFMITTNVESTEVIDKYHVRMKTSLDMPLIMLRILSCGYWGIVSKDSIQQHAGNTSAWESEDWGYDVFVGTGPFSLSEYLIDQKITLATNENWWAERKDYELKLEKIVVKYFGDASTLRMALEKKDIDTVFRNLDPLDVPDLIANPDIIVEEVPFKCEILHFIPAGGCEAIKDKRVRQAMAYAINVDEVLEKGFKDRGELTYSMMPLEATFWYLPVLEKYRNDTEKAKQLLEDAGYPNGFEIDMWIYDKQVDTALVIKEHLKDVEITLNLHLTDRVDQKGRASRAEVPIYMDEWWADYSDPHNWMVEPIQYRMGYSGWSNTTFNELIDLGLMETDDTVRKQYYDQIQNILGDEMIDYVLCYSNKVVANQKWVENFTYYVMFHDEWASYGFSHIGTKD